MHMRAKNNMEILDLNRRGYLRRCGVFDFGDARIPENIREDADLRYDSSFVFSPCATPLLLERYHGYHTHTHIRVRV